MYAQNGQQIVAPWAEPQIAYITPKVPPQLSAADPAPFLRQGIFELNAANPGGGPAAPTAAPGRLFSGLELGLDFRAADGVALADAISYWEACELLVTATSGVVEVPIYRRKLSTMVTMEATPGLGPTISGVALNVRGRPAQIYRGYVLNNQGDAPPTCQGTAIAWGDPSLALSGDQAGRPVVDTWCRPDQTFTWRDRLFSASAGQDVTMRTAAGDSITSNPSGGRLFVSHVALGAYSAGSWNVELRTGPVGVGPYSTVWGLARNGAQTESQHFSPPLVFLPGSSLNVLASTTTSISIHGFVE